ncbi:MAG TPA: hypothetical protein VGH99_04265 [Pseudonocardia sp.]|jgi:hypothetical protein
MLSEHEERSLREIELSLRGDEDFVASLAAAESSHGTDTRTVRAVLPGPTRAPRRGLLLLFWLCALPIPLAAPVAFWCAIHGWFLAAGLCAVAFGWAVLQSRALARKLDDRR